MIFFTVSFSRFAPSRGKRPKAENGGKTEIEVENGPKLDLGKNGKKRPKKWKNNDKPPQKPIFGPFFFPFCPPVQLGAVFHFDFHFFPISGFWPFSRPCQPGMIPTQLCGLFLRWPRTQRTPRTNNTTRSKFTTCSIFSTVGCCADNNFLGITDVFPLKEGPTV